MPETYITIKHDGEAEMEVKKSRFITSLKRIETEDEAKTFIAGLKKTHWKANHNCSAYVLGANNEIQRSSDDGEPSGTAGVPMLEVLKKNQLSNVCVVVTRYFGGTKLGAGGLIRAYSHAVSHGLTELGLVIGKPQQEIRLTIAYSLLGKLQSFLENQWHTKDTLFTESVTVICLIDEDKVPDFTEQVIDLLAGQVTIEKGEISCHELPLNPIEKEND